MNLLAAPLAAVAISATLLAGSSLPASTADVVRPAPRSWQVEPADRTVHEFHPSYVEPTRRNTRWFVEFNDGSSWMLVPCKHEDSTSCFWDASTRGNRRGWVLINVNNVTFRMWKAGR